MIKLQELITDDLDSEIKSNINELGKLTEEIERVKKEILKPMEDKYKDVVSTTLPILEKMGKETLSTKKYVFKILKKKHYRSSVSYRQLFETSLSKVNRQTKKLLNSIKDELTKMSLIQSKFSIQPIEGIGDSMKKLIKGFKMRIKKLLPLLKSIVSTNKELKKMI